MAGYKMPCFEFSKGRPLLFAGFFCIWAALPEFASCWCINGAWNFARERNTLFRPVAIRICYGYSGKQSLGIRVHRPIIKHVRSAEFDYTAKVHNGYLIRNVLDH